MTEQDREDVLPPQPEPKAEPQAPPPGGPHAVPGVGGEGAYSAEPRDPNPDKNPATDELPLDTTQGEDTETQATQGDSHEDAEDESTD